MRKLLASRAPALLAGGLPGMDPKMREAQTERLERLGVNLETLKSGKGGDALVNVMMSRLGQRQPPAGQQARRRRLRAPTFHSTKDGTAFTTCSAERRSRTQPFSARR